MYPHQDKALNEHLRNFAVYDCIQYYFHFDYFDKFALASSVSRINNIVHGGTYSVTLNVI